MSENYSWLLNVLDDLHAYTKKNQLSELSNIIEASRKIAAAEIASRAAKNAMSHSREK